MNIFIGYDENESIAYHVAAQSIMDRASGPVSISPLNRRNLPMLSRSRGEESTAFSYSRFLVPYLCRYQGYAIYMDCDVLLRDDILQIMTHYDDKAVCVVKHDYTPRNSAKFFGQAQIAYTKKNWSSVMIFNNSACRELTPAVVDSAAGLYLHQFQWLDDDASIGELPAEWNYLVGEYPRSETAKLVHFTEGSPCFAAYADCDYADEWHECRGRVMHYNKLGEYAK